MSSLPQNTLFEQLTTFLAAWHGRRRLRNALLWVPRAVLAGLLLAVLLATVARLRPFLDNAQVGLAALGLAAAGLLGSLLFLLLRRHTLLEKARFADRAFALRERASTAVEIHQGDLAVPADLARQQLADTLRAAGAVNPQRALPLRPERRDWLMLLLAIALLTAAVLLPNPQETALKQARAVQQQIEEQVQALEALEEAILANPELTTAEQEALLEPVQNALEALDPAGLSQEEAIAVLSAAEADLRALESSFSPDDLRARLESAGRPLAESGAGQALGEALQNGQLTQAGAAAAALADGLPTLTAAEQAELAQDLAETAAALAEVDPELSQELAAAAAALQNGDAAAAQQALQSAAGTLQQRAQEAAAAQQAQAAAGQLQAGRQAVAEAGQDQGQQQGQGDGQGQGQGDGQGQGAGQGQGQGQGQGEGQGQGQGQGTGGSEGEGTGGPGPGGGHAENVFVPDFVDLSAAEGEQIELPAECVTNPAQCGGLLSETPTEFGSEGSSVPYVQVFGDYRDAAYEALSDDYIPLGMKGFVRDYFSSLEP